MRRSLAFSAIFLIPAACTADPKATSQQQELVANGGFENGIDGWGYEQWANRPLPGVIDKTDKAEGAASFKMGLPAGAGARWLGTEIPIKDIGHDHILSLKLKLNDVPYGGARVRVGIPDKGWFTGGDLVRIGGTQDWKTYKFLFPGSALGDSKKVTLFIYDDNMSAGTIGIDSVSFTAGTLGPGEATSSAEAFGYTGVTLDGDTSRPDSSLYAPGEPVELNFEAGGLKTAKEPLTLNVSILDDKDQKLGSNVVPILSDAEGHCRIKVTAPSQKLGFYRAYVKLSNGVRMRPLGSRPADFLTYAVVPDPAKRVDYGEIDSRFGMQGAWGADVCSLLGIRWVLEDALEWQKMEPDRAGQFGPDQANKFVTDGKPGSSSFRVASLPTLMQAPAWATVPGTLIYMTGTLTPDGERAWAAYCKAAAGAYAAKYPDRKERVYQITWEPIAPWGFKGTDEDLIRIYQIAYKAVHEGDPRAVVAGPCRGINNNDPQYQVRLFKLGLGKYLDAYITHPYFSITPEQDGMVREVRAVKEMLRAYTGRDMPMLGSEQGWTTDEDISKELLQAQGLLRQSLITIGEGYRFNFGFCLADYRLGPQKGYGYFYNLVDGVPFGPTKIGPKPIAPAYAAQTLLLDGCKSDGAIEWLGEKIWGYTFERPDPRRSNSGSPAIPTKGSPTAYRALAVWNYGSEPREVSIPTGTKQVHVFDWMGNERLVDSAGGSITLKLGPEPVYITGVSPKMWGSSAPKALSLAQSNFHSFPGSDVSVAGDAVMATGRPFQGTLLLQTDKSMGIQPLSRQVSLGTNKQTPFKFALHLPAAVQAGAYTARLLLHDAAGSTVFATTMTLDVGLPLSVDVRALAARGGKPGVLAILQDKQGRGLSGVLNFSLKEVLPGAQRPDLPMIDLVQDPAKTKDVPGSSRQVPFKVSAGGSRRLVIDLPDVLLSPIKRYQTLVTVTTAGGAKFSQTASIDFLTATRLSGGVTIDGDLSDWPTAPAVTLSGPGNVVRSAQFYPAGLSAQFHYAWNDRALCIAAEVKDDVFIQTKTGGDTWSQDCLQLAFNLDPQLNGGVNAGDRRTSELTVALTPEGPQISRNLSSAPDKMGLGLVPKSEIKLAIKRVGAGGLVYEMEIPWTSLGMADGQPFKAGDVIGVAATVNEVRSPDQSDPSALGVFGGITPDKDPDNFGTLVLAGAG